MSDERPPISRERSDATWAHNRWPTVGLYTGAGIGAVLGLTLWAGVMLTIVYTIALGVCGCLLGYIAAMVMYPDADPEEEDP